MSEAMRQQLITGGVTPGKVVWNGIPVLPARPALTSVPTVVFAVAEKGVDVLLAAFAQVVQQIPEAQLWIAEEGKERDHIHALIHTLKLHQHVSLLGHLSHTELDDRAFQSGTTVSVPLPGFMLLIGDRQWQ